MALKENLGKGDGTSKENLGKGDDTLASIRVGLPLSVIRGRFPHRHYSRSANYINGRAGTDPVLLTAGNDPSRRYYKYSIVPRTPQTIISLISNLQNITRIQLIYYNKLVNQYLERKYLVLEKQRKLK